MSAKSCWAVACMDIWGATIFKHKVDSNMLQPLNCLGQVRVDAGCSGHSQPRHIRYKLLPFVCCVQGLGPRLINEGNFASARAQCRGSLGL